MAQGRCPEGGAHCSPRWQQGPAGHSHPKNLSPPPFFTAWARSPVTGTRGAGGVAPNGTQFSISKALSLSHPITRSLTVNPDLQPAPVPKPLGPPDSTTPRQPLALRHKGSSVALPEILHEKPFVPSKSLVTPVPPAQDSQGKAGGSCGGSCWLALPSFQPSRCFIALCLINISSHVLNGELTSAPSSQTAPCLGVRAVGVWICPGGRVSPGTLKKYQ